MKGIKNFVTGFTLSLISVSVAGQLYTSVSANTSQKNVSTPVKIDLFKKAEISPHSLPQELPIDIEDNSFLISEAVPMLSTSEQQETASLSLKDTPAFIYSVPSEPTDADIAYSPEGIEDDEILQVNVDDIVPIDFSEQEYNENASFNDYDDSQVAMLPADTIENEEIYSTDDTWLTVKGNKHTKNKKIIEKYTRSTDAGDFINDFNNSFNKDKQISYQVAEKIKQSIIFPIPDEILNDENLTPTFASPQSKKQTQSKSSTKQSTAKPVQQQPKATSKESLQILSKKQPETIAKETENKSFLDSISSWFSDKPGNTQQAAKAKTVPSYSSQGEAKQPKKQVQSSDNSDLLSFYETLQETKEEYTRNNVVPAELKLSFQPNRAEISGSTLHWLKIFSDAAQKKNTYLQVRLDASAPIELQRKRLNLLYTIFINNGVDPKKVDTVFSSTEPNAFIIRTLKLKAN